MRRAVWLWINRLVVGLDLCPFAMESLPGLRVVISDATGRDDTLDLITDEMKLISTSPMDSPATTVLVFPLALFDQMWRSGPEDPHAYTPDLEDEEEEWSSLSW